ncbi:hypothetical protein WN51_02122 [Melipona quadrifasciata]|uniref:Uncharacterized protein n=1 Tax=Melipona quadrifasciata TaxID=166423 RepID=A0A0N0BDU5_9HYME|nr:hypothetical protein WN51_02122 [Melipona quadrifasciata]
METYLQETHHRIKRTRKIQEYRAHKSLQGLNSILERGQYETTIHLRTKWSWGFGPFGFCLSAFHGYTKHVDDFYKSLWQMSRTPSNATLRRKPYDRNLHFSQ